MARFSSPAVQTSGLVVIHKSICQARRADIPLAGAVRHRIGFPFTQFPRAIGGEAADRSWEGSEKVQSSGGLHHRHRLCRPFGPKILRCSACV